MHLAISTTFKVLGLLLVAMILAALLPLGTNKPFVIGVIAVGLGLGCFWIVSLALLHGQVTWRSGTFHATHDRFYFWFYLLFYALAGTVCVIVGVGGVLA